MRKILVIHGPNLDLLGSRQPEIYGKRTLNEVNETISVEAERLGCSAVCFQSNSEEAIVEFIRSNATGAIGLLMNPGILTHYAVALRDTISASGLTTIEIHLSNVHAREAFRHLSVVTPVCKAQIAGLGVEGYLAGLRYLAAQS